MRKSDEAPTGTRLAILDAAERIFANEGYNGAVMRDIANAAGVNLGLIQYYFGSKDRLFVAAVDRRYAEWHDRVTGGVAAAAAAPGANAESIIRAFLEPFFAILASDDSGWIHYLRLLGRGMSSYAVEKVHPALRKLSQIPDGLKQALRGACDVEEGVALDLASYLLEVSVTYIVQDRGLMAARTGNDAGARQALSQLDFFASYFAAAFEARALRSRGPAGVPAGAPTGVPAPRAA